MEEKLKARIRFLFIICLTFGGLLIFMNISEMKIMKKIIKTSFSTNICHDYDKNGYWEKINFPILPLKSYPYFCQKDIAWGRIHADMLNYKELHYVWHSPGCDMKIYNNTHVKTIFGKKIWIHIEGDSLFREMYEDIRDYFLQKCMPGLKKTFMFGSFEAENVFVSYVKINHRFKRKKCENFQFTNFQAQIKGKTAPDVLIVNLGLHHLWLTENVNKTLYDYDLYNEQMECFNTQAKPLNSTFKIYRLTTPSTRWGIDEIKKLNKIAYKTLDTSLWRMVDVWNMLNSRYKLLTKDNVHFYGPGSKWMTNILLNIIAKEEADRNEKKLLPRSI